jgi:hypothetical protein
MPPIGLGACVNDATCKVGSGSSPPIVARAITRIGTRYSKSFKAPDLTTPGYWRLMCKA